MNRIRDLVAVIITGLAAAILSGSFGAGSVPAEREAVPMPAEILLAEEDSKPVRPPFGRCPPEVPISVVSEVSEPANEGGLQDVTPVEPSSDGAALETAESNDARADADAAKGDSASPAESESDSETAEPQVSSAAEDPLDDPTIEAAFKKSSQRATGDQRSGERNDRPWRVDLRSNVHLTLDLAGLSADDVLGLADYVVLFLDNATFRLEPDAADSITISRNRLCMPLREKLRPRWVWAHLENIMADRSDLPSDVRLILSRRWHQEIYRRVFDSIGESADFARTDYEIHGGFRRTAFGIEFVVNRVERRPIEPTQGEETMKDEGGE